MFKEVENRIKDLEDSVVDVYTHLAAIPNPLKGDKGDKGDFVKGDKGDKGDQGLSAYEVWLSQGARGTERDFLQSLKAKNGENGISIKGDQGEKGDKGDKGDPGLSAYEIWISKGNEGSENDFLETLKGKDGITTIQQIHTYGDGGRGTAQSPHRLVPTDGLSGQVLAKLSDENNDFGWVYGGGGSGTVTSVSVVTANGVSGSVANPTTTPAITLSLGDITPTSIVASGAISGSNLSGTNTGNQNLFSTIAVAGQSDIVADSPTDTLTIVAGTNITLTTNATTDTLTINSSGGGGSSAFNDITSGTNTTAAMVIGTGASLGVSGSGTIVSTSCTGNAATVTTNANLTGVITSVGNATSIASQTGTGSKFVVDNTPTIISQVVSTGLTASGSASNDFSASTGTFKTSTGANTLSGAVTINDATTPSLTTASGKTNTGFVQVNGKTSGALKITTADAAAQTITLNLAAQTVGAATLTIPNMANTNKTIAWLESPAFITPDLGTPSALVGTNITGTGASFTAGTATVANTVSTANEASDTTCFPLFITASGTQSLQPKNNTGLTYNSSTNNLGATTFTGALSGNATTATALATARAIYGNNFDGSADLTQIIASTYGGTGNGFTKFTGAASTEKTYTLPNATCTILTSNAAVTVAQGGTNSTSAGITAFNNITGYSAAGATGTTSTNLVFSTSPTLVTPTLGVASATSINKVAITAPASGATITIADGKTLTASNTLTFTGTDSSSVAFGAGGTVAYVGTAQTFTAAQRGAFSTLTDAATVAVDLSLANNYNLTLGGNRTLGVPTNPVAGQTGVISVRQDITGSRTLSYSWPYEFPSGTAPTLSTGKLVFDQLYYCVNYYSTATVTVTIATPAVMTWTSHGLVSGQKIQLTTSGALPTGLSANTTYWVTVTGVNTFNLSTSLANAQAGTLIATSGSQSGTHTAVAFSITISNNLGIA